MEKAIGHYKKLMKYALSTCGLDESLTILRARAKGKQYSALQAVEISLSGIFTNAKSANQLHQHGIAINQKRLCNRAPMRSTIGELLNEARTVEALTGALWNLFKVCQGLRILKLSRYHNLLTAFLDGIDLGEVHQKGGHCNLCLKREKDGKISFYHQIVVLSVASAVGPIPIAMNFVKPDVQTADFFELSLAMQKQNSELGAMKALLFQLAKRNGGKLPFKILGLDALYANAPAMEFVENLGAFVIAVFKQENRKLFQAAKEDFHSGFGFGVNEFSFSKDPSGKGRIFDCKMATYIDNNRKGPEKSVKIIETTRIEKDGTSSITMAITSNYFKIDAYLVEALRYGRWHDIENGVFNELTNTWGILKHLFFHQSNATISMLCIMLLCISIACLYRFRNLRRGQRKWQDTLKAFLEHMKCTFFSARQLRNSIFHGPDP